MLITNTPHHSLAATIIGDGRLLDLPPLPRSAMHSPASKITIAPDFTALVLYTSGSTGNPKGVAHAHESIMQDVINYTNATHYCPRDRLAVLGTLCDATSFRPLFGALLNGAALALYDIATRGLGEMRDWLSRHEVTVYRSVPTVFLQFAKTLTGRCDFPALRLIILGGETVTPQHVALYRRHFPDHTILMNRLGCTEALTFSHYFIDKLTPIEDDHVPVGYALEGKTIILLDEDGTPIVDDSIGEIVVKSRYISSGYVGAPELNLEKFHAVPGDTARRIYRTGDLGRRLRDGCLMHHGRKDLQVNVNGHRIDLQELEAKLSSHAGVAQAVVVSKPDDVEGVRVVAYVLLAPDAGTSVGAVRQWLADRVPKHMLPSAWIEQKSFPTLPSGKVDLQSLPAPVVARALCDRTYLAPRSELERTIAMIWQEVLGLDRVGIHDRFDELGGDSLRAMLVVWRIAKKSEGGIDESLLLDAPTIAEMANRIARHRVAVDCRDAGN